jgi:hypothetical protein
MVVDFQIVGQFLTGICRIQDLDYHDQNQEDSISIELACP